MIECGSTSPARIASLNVGRPRPLRHGTVDVSSAIRKQPVSGRLWLGETGLTGDEQADTKNHGGPDKAVCVYALEHYPRWSERLGTLLTPPAFGENFSTRGLVEYGVCIGDIYQVGSTIVQVSQPRIPCYKLGARNGCPEFVAWVTNSGLTGYYFRCLEPGEVGTGDTFSLMDRLSPEVTVAEANRVMHRDRDDRAGIERLLSVTALAASWRERLERRLSRV